MIHEFRRPIPVVVEGGKEGYALYVTDNGTFEDDFWCVVHCEGGIVRHHTAPTRSGSTPRARWGSRRTVPSRQKSREPHTYGILRRNSMKLTSIQLRKIIAEEVAKAVEEAEGSGGDDMNSVVDAALTAFYDAAPKYDPEDPSMRGQGESGWGEQVDAAGEDFRNELSALLDRVMDKLYAGEYMQ